MRARAVLWRVELPIAAPLIMAGIRTSAINIVATATLAALVAYGGLGRFIVDGLAQRDTVQLFSGALLVALLSVGVELGLRVLQRITTPVGMRTQTSTQDVGSTALSTAQVSA
jgi:osmoprotectant transport system permease protein